MTKMEDIGIEAKKAKDFSEWYQQIVIRAKLADYTPISGCIVFRPRSYAIWQKIREYLDKEFKKRGVQNAYFPLLIPEKLLTREQEHVKGFTPEVAWVTHSGQSRLSERLAVRPTSEAIMYDSYSKWVRSWRDLPLLINQWCNIVRWEFKHAVPFLRTREFLWQEGHTVHSTKSSADKEVMDILGLYEKACKEVLAIPMIQGRKSEKEKFAGALYTTSIETFLPNGKAIQGGTSHCLGQNFAKAFGIQFLDKKEKKQFAWQNSWGVSTRLIGIMIMMHSDDKGLVLPPAVADPQAVIVPILFEKTREKVLKACEGLAKSFKTVSVHLDKRDDFSPGWKFNEWELYGVPVRIEVGPKELDKSQCILVRRDTGEKKAVKIKEAEKETEAMLKAIQKSLYDKAKKNIEASTVVCKDKAELKKAIKEKKLVLMPWCEEPGCEELVKYVTNGAKLLCAPFDQPKKKPGKCAHCGKPAKAWWYVAKSY